MNPDFDRAFDEGIGKISGWIEGLIQNIPNIVAALLMLLLFLAAARLVRRALTLGMRRVRHSGLVVLVGGLVQITIIGIGIIVALSILNLDETVTALLAGAGIVGLAVGFAFQESAQTFLSGVFLTLRQPFRDGDIVQTNEFLGTVEAINMRATELRTFQGQKVIIPNRKVFQEPLVNFSDLGLRRIDLEVGISYADDLERARAVAIQAIEPLPMRDRTRPVELFYEGFGDSSIGFEVRFWIPFRSWTDFLAARSEAVIAIRKAFDAADVTIPFPIRTLDFSRVGGVPLRDELRAGGAGRE